MKIGKVLSTQMWLMQDTVLIICNLELNIKWNKKIRLETDQKIRRVRIMDFPESINIMSLISAAHIIASYFFYHLKICSIYWIRQFNTISTNYKNILAKFDLDPMISYIQYIYILLILFNSEMTSAVKYDNTKVEILPPLFDGKYD